MNETVVEIRRYSGEIERHRHDYPQVILPISGALEIDLGHRSGRVSGSTGAFVSAGCQHAFYAKQTDSFVVLDLPSRRGIQEPDEDIPAFFAIGREIHGLIDYMAVQAGSRELSASLRHAWSTLLLDRVTPPNRPDRAELAIRRATAFIERKLADPIRIADIAEAAGMSPTRLHEAFTKRRATTPHAHLVAMRLDAAERMLADPRLSIADIAILSGHSDQSALTRAMRRERDSTPAEVRRNLLGRTGGNA
ncbi:AraC family transcriptional regulator [Mesorhizobium sp. GbtcB19]|uniref:AraC family transcriptional regulator n=1 Tax=Mesorhizobium sp. GbtcB19 TaxID=2824764 RepID=UPI001C2F6C40|nr:AraC family transcriptional regulator [Mesorhizobium sp. GbtcB19]